MRYLKSINEYNREDTKYDSIFRDLRSIFNKNMNYLDEPTMSYKELYNMLISIKHRAEELLNDIEIGENLQWIKSTGSSVEIIEEELKEISSNCYQFTRSKRNLEELKELI